MRDRIVHHALMAEVEPVLERRALETSFACRVGKGGLAAIRSVQNAAGHFPYVLRLDISRFFKSIEHRRLIARLNEVVADPRLRNLIRVFVDLGAPNAPPGFGLPVGNLTSQHFANDYLGALDRYGVEGLGLRRWIRYMDDVVAFGHEKRRLWECVDALGSFVHSSLGLSLNERVTKVLPVTEGIPFLGFRIWPDLVRLDGPHFRRLRRRFHRLERAIDLTRLTEDDAVRSAAGLVGHAIHAHPSALRHASRRRAP